MAFRLYMLQRLTAILLAPLVLAHLILIIYAFQGGLTAGEILGRTQGSVGWALFYGLFTFAVSIHAAIGLRVILAETLKISDPVLNGLGLLIFLGLLYFGLGAVYAVTTP